jgi:hypothetical protein
VLAVAMAACGGRTPIDGNANSNGANGNGNGGRNDGDGGDGSSEGANACARGTPTFLASSTRQDARSVATDGARVYWTTWGTDASQNGGMILSASVNGGASTVLATNEGTTTDILVDGANVYWMNYGDALRAMPKTGGAPRTLMSVDQPMSFAIDDAFAYVTTTGGIWRVALAGGAPEKIVVARTGEAIAVDDAHVYWIDRGTANDDSTSLSRAPKSGGAPEVLVAGRGVFSEAVTSSLVVDGASAYWVATRADGVVAKVDKAGGTPTTLVSGLVCPYTLRMHGASLVYANAVIACGPTMLPARTLGTVSTNGAGAAQIANVDHIGVQGAFAIDARNVYFTGGPREQRGIWCTAYR